jgi:hypothetical protein
VVVVKERRRAVTALVRSAPTAEDAFIQPVHIPSQGAFMDNTDATPEDIDETEHSEDDDTEGHGMFRFANKGPELDEDDDEDTEGHGMFRFLNRGSEDEEGDA